MIAGDAVHVWQVDLADAAWDAAAVLCAEERQRAEAFRTEVLAQRYRRARTALRLLLGRYLGRAPEEIQLTYGPYGKPELAGQPLHFNLSHSADQCLIALAGLPVGVDIETLGPGVNPAELLDLVCHPHEREELAGLTDAQRRRQFLTLWAFKEAYCKALGMGLQVDLPSIRMIPAPPEPTFRVLDEWGPGPSYYVHPLPCPIDFRASLCVPLRCPRLKIQMAGSAALVDD